MIEKTMLAIVAFLQQNGLRVELSKPLSVIHPNTVRIKATNKEGGVIIMVAALSDGTGGAGFYTTSISIMPESECTRRSANDLPRRLR